MLLVRPMCVVCCLLFVGSCGCVLFLYAGFVVFVGVWLVVNGLVLLLVVVCCLVFVVLCLFLLNVRCSLFVVYSSLFGV